MKNIEYELALLTNEDNENIFIKKKLLLLLNNKAEKYSDLNTKDKIEISIFIKSLATINKLLVAKMIVYSRIILKNKGVSNYASVILASVLEKEDWGKRFFTKRDILNNENGAIFDLNDILEIASCYFEYNNNKNLSNPMKKGFRKTIENSSRYEISHNQKNNTLSLSDIINITHPKIKNNLKSTIIKLHNNTLEEIENNNDIIDYAINLTNYLLKNNKNTSDIFKEINNIKI